MSQFAQDPSFQRFVEEAKTHGVVYVLADGEDLLVVESVEFEDTDVMPFWSMKHRLKRIALMNGQYINLKLFRWMFSVKAG